MSEFVTVHSDTLRSIYSKIIKDPIQSVVNVLQYAIYIAIVVGIIYMIVKLRSCCMRDNNRVASALSALISNLPLRRPTEQSSAH